jgi:hypothetical protein
MRSATVRNVALWVVIAILLYILFFLEKDDFGFSVMTVVFIALCVFIAVRLFTVLTGNNPSR